MTNIVAFPKSVLDTDAETEQRAKRMMRRQNAELAHRVRVHRTNKALLAKAAEFGRQQDKELHRQHRTLKAIFVRTYYAAGLLGCGLLALLGAWDAAVSIALCGFGLWWVFRTTAKGVK